MRLLDSIRFRIAALVRRSQMNDELGEELRSHLQLRADDLERSGLPRTEAERRAALEFGSVEGFREQCQRVAGGVLADSLRRDLRYAVRVLRKSPAFTGVAILTVALAIGANAVAFAALNAIVLRPLNVPRPDSLYSIHRVGDNSAAQSYPTYLDHRERNRSFEDLAAYNFVPVGFEAGESPVRVWANAVTGNYFDVLGIRPHLGRFLSPADDRGDSSAPNIVISWGFWQSRFAGDPNVIGRTVRLNKHPYVIVGVTPRDFNGTLLFAKPEIYLPFLNQEQLDGVPFLKARGNRTRIFITFGHLKPGVTPEQAVADINAISADLEKTYPNEHAPATFTLGRPSLYGDFMGRPMKAFVTALMVLSALILFAACANLGSLFAARAADRTREIALRLALGAGRARVLRQLFTEAVLISVVGGALGLLGSVLLLRALQTWRPMPQFPIDIPLHADANVYVFAVLLALATGFLFGAAPVAHVLRTDPYEVVKAGATSTLPHRVTVRELTVVLQIAICAVLVTASIVAVRGLLRSMHSDYGFQPQNAILVETLLEMAGYRGGEVAPMQKRIIEAAQQIPGVTHAAMIDVPPLSNGSILTAYVFPDATADLRPANAITLSVNYKISPGYLEAAGTPLLDGRDITWHDDESAPRVALLNPEFARLVFGAGENALGRFFKLRDGTRVQVVGVVPNGRYQSLTENARAAMFLPLLQSPSSQSFMVVRSGRPPEPLAADLRNKLRELDPGLPIFIQTWNDNLSLVLFPSRVAAFALGILGAIGAMLSITGIFGLAAYSVSRRMRELGIRIALGAQRREVLHAAVGRALKLLGFGSAAGLLLGILASRVLASIVYQATPRDPIVLAGVVLAMLGLGLLATWIPARRAMSIDPLALLREP